MGKISTSTRYIIDITGTDLFCFGELGGGLGLILKNEVFVTYEGLIGSQ